MGFVCSAVSNQSIVRLFGGGNRSVDARLVPFKFTSQTLIVATLLLLQLSALPPSAPF